MGFSFRGYLANLEACGELRRIEEPVDLRYVSALLGKSAQALLFTHLVGYPMPLVGGLLSTRRRLELAFGTQKVGLKMRDALERSIPPQVVQDSPAKEVIWRHEEVDLARLPLPVVSAADGGPYISGGVLIATDPDYGRNAGVYRLMYRTRNTFGIDITTPNNLKLYCQRAFAQGKAVEVAISLGVHPFHLVAACYKGALGLDELNIAGGLLGEPVALIPAETVGAQALAEAEIVLEGRILSQGWAHPEGRFGEFTRLMGGVHLNPLVQIDAITMRRDAIFYALHMPWENIWIGEPAYEAAAWRVLREAGVEVTALNVTQGGCCHWHVVAAIRKYPGDGKNALLALLSIADIKHAIVTDDDIDIFNPDEVEWAVATRVQADRDVIIVSGARAKPLDPSLAAMLPPLTTAKMGIDATIPEGVPREAYERIAYPFAGLARLEASGVLAIESPAGSPGVGPVEERLEALLAAETLYFAQIMERLPQEDYQTLVRAFGRLNEEGRLERDELGRYHLASKKD